MGMYSVLFYLENFTEIANVLNSLSEKKQVCHQQKLPFIFLHTHE